MKKLYFTVFFLSALLNGCVFIDDDDNDGPRNYQETIIYVNYTGYSIDNYIDNIYVGTVGPSTELRVYGYDFDGTHLYFSKCQTCSLEWGPTEFFVHDGESFTIYLEDSGMTFSRQ
jgi:hypothetical protein